ncbi:MAG: BspA family leucine-rich repeat surface protein [Roseburia sp.]|nr:BspA family leucine-rich repeat surface protein [Roseburia sp.]
MKAKGKRILAYLLAAFVLLAGCVTADTASVEAAAKKPTKITLNQKTAEMSVGDTLTLKVKSVTPKNASKSVKWTTSNKKIATVTNKGKVAAKKDGKVTITAASQKNKKVSAKCKITVYKATKKLTLSGSSAYTLKAGESVTLKATVTPAKGAQPIAWSTSDKKVATVSSKGKVTAVAAGTATITGKSGKKKVTAKITVEAEASVNASGTWKGIDWKLENGKLTLSGEAEEGTKFGDGSGMAGEYFLTCPWGGNDYRNSVTSAEVKVSGLTDMSYMFASFESLTSVDFEGTDTSKVTNMTSMFSSSLHYPGKEKRKKLVIKNLNTKNVTNMNNMFFSAQIEELDLSSMEIGDINVQWMLAYIQVGTIKLPKKCPANKITIEDYWQDAAGNVYTGYLPETTGESFTITKMPDPTSGVWYGMEWNLDDDGKLTLSGEAAGTDAEDFSWFSVPWYKSRDKVKSMDVSVTGLTNAKNMCGGSAGFTTLTSINMSKFDTSKITNMQSMFAACSGLTSIDASGWNTSSVTNMHGMFDQCSGLTSIDVSGWDTSSVTEMSGMFYKCSSLTSIDVSGWNTSSVTDMSSMFEGCSSLTSIDMSGWDTNNESYMDSMFEGCSSLKTIKLPKNLQKEFCKIPMDDNGQPYGTWKDEAGNTYTEYLPATSDKSITVTKVE